MSTFAWKQNTNILEKDFIFKDLKAVDSNNKSKIYLQMIDDITRAKKRKLHLYSFFVKNMTLLKSNGKYYIEFNPIDLTTNKETGAIISFDKKYSKKKKNELDELFKKYFDLMSIKYEDNFSDLTYKQIKNYKMIFYFKIIITFFIIILSVSIFLILNT